MMLQYSIRIQSHFVMTDIQAGDICPFPVPAGVFLCFHPSQRMAGFIDGSAAVPAAGKGAATLERAAFGRARCPAKCESRPHKLLTLPEKADSMIKNDNDGQFAGQLE